MQKMNLKLLNYYCFIVMLLLISWQIQKLIAYLLILKQKKKIKFSFMLFINYINKIIK